MNEPLPLFVVSHDDSLLPSVHAELTRAGIPCTGQRVAAEELHALADAPASLCVVEDRACGQPRALCAPADSLLVMLCDPDREAFGAAAMDAGFADYLLRDNLARLGPLVRRWLARRSTAPFSLPRGEARFRELLQRTPDAIAFFEVLGGRIFILEEMNPAAERLLGARGDALGRRIVDLLPGPVGSVVRLSLQRAVEAGQPVGGEQCWELPGGPRWLHALLVPSDHAGASPHRVAAVWRDISDHKSYEKALLDREEMFRRLVETTNVIPWEADSATGRFTYVGPQAAKRFGYAAEAWLREGFWADHLHPDDRAQAVEAFVRLSQSAGEYELEYRMLAQDGEVVWLHDLVSAEADRRGRLALRGFLVDVTARRQAEEEARRLAAELERRVVERTAQLAAANRELEAFSYSVSHDLRAPLRSIDGFSKALLEDYEATLDEDGRDMLRRVRAASQRMGQLIDDLLQLARVSRAELRAGAVDLSEVARLVVRSLSQEAPDRRIEWILEPDLSVNGDAALLRVVLENLLGNAHKYTARKAHARIEFGRDGDTGEFFVRDDGAGFDPEYAARLFQPFHRLHHPDEFEGHGIGLATVQRIIHRHGGRVRGVGAVGRGAAFYFTLSLPEGLRADTWTTA